LYKKWSFHTVTGSVASDLNRSNSSSVALTRDSWFTVKCRKAVWALGHTDLPSTATHVSKTMEKVHEARATNLPTTSCPLSPSLLQEIMECAQRTTDKRENVHVQAEMKAKERKLRMQAALQVKTQARRKTQQQKEKDSSVQTIIQVTSVESVDSSPATRSSRGRKRSAPETNRSTVTHDTHLPHDLTDGIEEPLHKRSKVTRSIGSLPSPLSTSGLVETPSSPVPPSFKKPHIVSDPEKAPPCRMRKYRLNPTTEQKNQLRKALGVTTWTYNQCVAGARAKTAQPVIADLRTQFLNAKSHLVQDKEWVTEVPYDLRDEAAKDFAQAWKANETKKKKGDVHAMHANFRFQNKYRKSRKLVIHAKHYWGPGVFHPSFFGMTPFRCREKLPASLSYDATLTMNWLGQVHLYIPAPLEKHASVGVLLVAPNPIVAIDPGVRTFGTLFDPKNQQYIEWGAE
jgi:hypothetical protein